MPSAEGRNPNRLAAVRTTQAWVAALLLCWPHPPARADAAFAANIRPIPAADRARMQGIAWHPGCPVALDDLASIRLSYWDFDGRIQVGVLVVHRGLAPDVVAIFRELFQARFPIARVEPYESFPAGGYAAANDTVGFYCRPDQGDPSKFGMHSYGYAIDINPLQNPYQDPRKGWWPPRAAANASRDADAPGKVTARSEAFAILTRHGWLWGGLFREGPDYMHFEKATIGGHPDPVAAPYQVDRLTYRPPASRPATP